MIVRLALVGYFLSGCAVAAVLTGAVFVRVTWLCGQCGKVNTTSLPAALLCWCDHEGTG